MTTTAVPRQIGRWGALARALVGIGLVWWAVMSEPGVRDTLLGLIVLPGVFTIALASRGSAAPPLRLEAAHWHCVNIGIGLVLFSWAPTAAMLFYGTSMLVAAWRGIGACELFAISNWLRGRDDRLGCPLFLPIDAAEAALSRR